MEEVCLVVCGHVHGMGGRDEEMSGTRVANAASHDNRGAPARIGLVEISGGGAVGPAGWHEVASARREVKQLMKIPGIGEKAAQGLIDQGIGSIKALLDSSPETLRERIPGYSWPIIRARAEAHNSGDVVCVSKPSFPSHPRLYLDIETDLDPQSLVWLIGVYHSMDEEMLYFFAETPSGEEEMLKSFLEYLDGNQNAAILHYSTTRFDKRILKVRLAEHDLPVPEQLENSMDVGLKLTRSVALPLPSYKLKEVAPHAGYSFAHPSMDGLEVATTYLRCAESGKQLPEKVFEYNRDDVLAVRAVVEWVEGI